MKCRHKPSGFQTHHELFPTNTGAMQCPARLPAEGTTTKKASDSTKRPNRLHTHSHSPKRLAHPRSPMPPLSVLTASATHAHPLNPAALASVPCEVALVRVRARLEAKRAHLMGPRPHGFPTQRHLKNHLGAGFTETGLRTGQLDLQPKSTGYSLRTLRGLGIGAGTPQNSDRHCGSFRTLADRSFKNFPFN